MDPVQWAFFIIQIAGDLSKLGIFVWLLTGGWKFVLRTIGFDIDTLLVSFIGRIYEYFMQVLTGTMFNEKVISELLQNVYVFVGVIMFFRLMMLVIKYLVNPDLVNDAKAGVNSLVQRVIIGLAGILFIPTLFDFALQLQAHIMQDNIIQQIIVPKDMLKEVESKVDKGGQYIGTYVLAGFISPGENATKKTRTEYENALENGDLSSLSTLRKDGWLVGEYEYDYFFLLSTFCLCYVLYLMVKYTLDVITRFFRMLMYQMLAPIAMIEYMINGSDNGVFKTWKQGVLGTYFMLFVRVLALWFVVFVMVLMAADNEYNAGTLLATDDYLLRALIIMALLGFMMDLPKLIGQVFGLDLEQEGNATGMLKQVGGMLKGAAMGGLAITGAAVGGAIGTGKAALGMTSLGKKYNQGKADLAKNKPEMMGMLNSLKQGTRGITAAAMGSNSFTGGLYKSYSGARDTQESIGKERDNTVESNQSKEKQKREEAERDALQAQRHQEILANQAKQLQGQEFDAVMNVTIRMDERGMPTDVGSVAAVVKPAEVAAVNASIQGNIATLAATALTAADVLDDGTISSSAQPTLRREVEEVVTRTYQTQGVDTSLPSVQQQITQQVDQVLNSAVAEVNSEGKVTLSVDTSKISAAAVGFGDQTITQVVNQVQGTRVSGDAQDATQVVNQQFSVETTSKENVTQSVDIQRKHSDLVGSNSGRSIPSKSDREIPGHLDDGSSLDV